MNSNRDYNNNLVIAAAIPKRKYQPELLRIKTRIAGHHHHIGHCPMPPEIMSKQADDDDAFNLTEHSKYIEIKSRNKQFCSSASQMYNSRSPQLKRSRSLSDDNTPVSRAQSPDSGRLVRHEICTQQGVCEGARRRSSNMITDEIRMSARRAASNYKKWQSIGKQLRQISEQFAVDRRLGRPSASNSRSGSPAITNWRLRDGESMTNLMRLETASENHPSQRGDHLQVSAISCEWSKLMLLICLAIATKIPPSCG